MASEDNGQQAEPAGLQPSCELLGMSVAGATLRTGERIKVLQIQVQIDIPMNLDASRALSDALLSANISVERELPEDLSG